MKKYFYTNGIDKFGPFSIEEMISRNLTRETKIWFYGLENWTPLSEIDELKSIINSKPPPIKFSLPIDIQANNKEQYELDKKEIEKVRLQKNRKLKQVMVTTVILSLVLLIGYVSSKNQENKKIYQEVILGAYETDLNFDFYVEKFYRDIGYYGIFPKKPFKTIIKFGNFEHIDNATHIHGVSFGMNDDDRIEIYINSTTWEKFNKPMRYYLIYHELAHDVLNVDDFKNHQKMKEN